MGKSAGLMIADYGMGNLRSVMNAFESLGCVAQIARHPEECGTGERIVLPGVGAFGDGMNNLRAGGSTSRCWRRG